PAAAARGRSRGLVRGAAGLCPGPGQSSPDKRPPRRRATGVFRDRVGGLANLGRDCGDAREPVAAAAMALRTLPDAPWRRRPGMIAILAALGSDEDLVRYVGGAVRDTLLDHEVKDVDLATPLTPDLVIQRLEAARIKAVPTGIDHGTITAVCKGVVVEVTTLRSDVSTDGRRATVAFTDHWQEDASRRDFTINALYAHPATSKIEDYFGGLADLEQGHVRFIGEPLTRIAEDHLRILRFFRFHARFGRGEPDRAALDACVARANDLMA